LITQKLFLSAMKALGVAFNRDMGPAATRVYYGVVGSLLTDYQFQEAARAVLSSCRYMPSPAELLETGLNFPRQRSLPAARLTEAEREARHEAYKRGYEAMRAELKARGIDVDAIAKQMPADAKAS